MDCSRALKLVLAAVTACSIVTQARADGGDVHPTLADPAVSSRLALFEIWTERQMVYRGQPGIAVGLVDRNGLLWGRGFGIEDLERGVPVTVDSVFRVGSISKLFAATAILQLVEEGRLRLDDAVAARLPAMASVGPVGDPVEPITLRHLLTHTAGLPREAAFPYWTDRRFPTIEAMLAALGDQPVPEGPGERIRYSNFGIALLGAVVEATTDGRYRDWVRRRIFEPLGMLSSAATWGEIDQQRLVTGYLIRRGGKQPRAPVTDARGLAPAADVSSTVADLARFVAAHLLAAADEPNGFVRGATAREMQRVQHVDTGWLSGRGLGFSVWRDGARTLVGHGGWVAGYRAQLTFDPAAGLGLIVLTNSDEGGPGIYARALIDAVWPAIEAARDRSDRSGSASSAVDDPGRFVGTYRNPWGEEREVLAWEGGLGMWDHSYPPTDLPGAATPLVRLEGDRFQLGDNGYIVVFERRPDDSVERIKIGENYVFPIDCTIAPGLRCVR